MPSPLPVTVTYFIEIMSSWCHWAEPAWVELKQRYASRVQLQWRVALMRPQDFPVSARQCDWFYHRSGSHVESPIKLNSGWFEADREGHYEAPNHVAEAGRDFLGESDERIRLALSHAALIEGQPIGDLDIAVRVAAAATGLDASALRESAESDAVRRRVATSTTAFFAHQISQRPAFIIENAIGDKTVFAGIWRAAPLIAAVDAQLDDAARYASHAARFGSPPAS
jgi:predicted DsbA family dithiol-disulfide isomerase